MTEKRIGWLFLAALVAFVLAVSGSRWRLNDTRPTLTAVEYIDALRGLLQ